MEFDGNRELILNSRLDEDEQFVEALNYLSNNLKIGPTASEQSLRMALEDRELELNQQYLEQFEKVNSQVQSFVGKIRSMNSICREMTEKIQSNKEKTRELLKKTAILQNEKKQLTAKQQYLEEFFDKYSLTQEEERSLKAANQASLTDPFFKALKRLLEVSQNASERVKLEPENLALMEMSQLLTERLDEAYATLYSSVQSMQRLTECRLSNVDFLELKPALIHSFEFLQSKPELFGKALEEYGNARRGFVVRAFIETLTKGKGSNDPLRYMNEMLNWIQYAIGNEKEMLDTLLRGCTRLVDTTPNQCQSVLSVISEALCQPLRLRIEQCITKEGNCVVLCRLSNLLLYYSENYREILSQDSHLLLCCRDLHELCSNMFYSSISSAIQRILANDRVPDYDLLPVNSINQALLLLRDILEAQNDTNTSNMTIDKREIYNKVFQHILDPLLQSVQLVCSNLDNHLDVAVYMLNCLNAIRSVIILYQFTDKKLEMIKAQIEANEDVLVSEQASQILMETDMMDLYTKAQAHQPNQGQLSKITGMEPGRVRDSFVRFHQFLESLDGYNCAQLAKISSSRIRESVQKRTYQHVMAAYTVIFQKVSDQINGYPTIEPQQSPDEVEKMLFK